MVVSPAPVILRGAPRTTFVDRLPSVRSVTSHWAIERVMRQMPGEAQVR